MSTKFTVKMDVLCEQFGWTALADLCPRPLADIRRALDEGDEHLNRWGNEPWDAVALGQRRDAPKTIECASCGHKSLNPERAGTYRPGANPYDRLRATMRAEPWKNGPRSQSLSMRGCALKHAARRAALAL